MMQGSRTSIGMKENNSNSLSGTASVNIDSAASPTSRLSSYCEDADSGISFSIVLYALYLSFKDFFHGRIINAHSCAINFHFSTPPYISFGAGDSHQSSSVLRASPEPQTGT